MSLIFLALLLVYFFLVLIFLGLLIFFMDFKGLMVLLREGGGGLSVILLKQIAKINTFYFRNAKINTYTHT